jgi:hypothetical protein
MSEVHDTRTLTLALKRVFDMFVVHSRQTWPLKGFLIGLWFTRVIRVLTLYVAVIVKEHSFFFLASSCGNWLETRPTWREHAVMLAERGGRASAAAAVSGGGETSR